MPKKSFKYIDLFAGIGGFAAALEAFGGEHVYSVEIDKQAAKVYEQNWRRSPLGDITLDANEERVIVGEHDILAAGFPCQPFSKSGAQRGMDETRGTLYFNILQIIEKHHPTVVLLENVRNLAGPRHVHEMKIIVKTLREAGYRVSDEPSIFSPHLLPREMGGRPQIRERVFITATYDPKNVGGIQAPEPVAMPKPVSGWNPQKWNLDRDLPLDHKSVVPGCELSEGEKLWINAWDEWVQMYYELSEGKNPPGFPIWADDWVEISDLKLKTDTPAWKANFQIKNADLYTRHKKDFDAWALKWGVFSDAFPPSRRKLEWQAQDTPALWDCVMHFRPSGIRAKKPTYLPALVAITQTSIIGPWKRRLSPREAARLQGLPDGFSFDGQKDSATYKQLGNGVNVGVVWNILKWHVARDESILKTTAQGRRILDAVSGSPASPDELLEKMFTH